MRTCKSCGYTSENGVHSCEGFKLQQAANDPIEPNHYVDMAISPLEYIKANNIEWNVANVIKYVSRYKAKNGLEDLKKAKWYLDDIIADMERADHPSQSHIKFEEDDGAID